MNAGTAMIISVYSQASTIQTVDPLARSSSLPIFAGSRTGGPPVVSTMAMSAAKPATSITARATPLAAASWIPNGLGGFPSVAI